MSRRPSALFALTALAALGGILPAQAADPSYLGDWKIDSAVVAPWAPPKPDASERDALVGKTVTLKPREIAGPKALACKGAKFKVTNSSVDLLFQGAFEEMHGRDKSADPLRLAASLGFAGTSWQTLETGCDIDWHFANPATVKIGLNDYVYTLKKQ